MGRFFGLPAVSNATPIVFTIDTEFDTLATVNFETVTVQDLGSGLELTVAVNTAQLGPNADLQWFYCNLVAGFTGVTLTGNDVVDSQFQYTPNANNPFRAAGGGNYDGFVSFGNGANPTIQATILTLSADQDLDLVDLYERSVGGPKGPYYMAIHAQSTNWSGGNGADSEWAGANTVNTPVPEPATMLLLGSSLLALVGFRRKLSKG